MALLVSDVIYEHREVLLSSKPTAMLAASPKGTVPVLVLPNGNVIDESLDIMRWALSQHDPEDWLSRVDNEMVEIFDGAFKHHLDRYKYAERYDCDSIAHFTEGSAIICDLAERLADHRYLGGASRGFDDIAIFPFIRQFAAVDHSRFVSQIPPHVREWLATLTESDLFQRAMAKCAPWPALSFAS